MGTTKLSYGLRPILLNAGVVSSQTHNGKICMTQLSTHLDIKEESIGKEKNISKILQLLYSLGRFDELWKVFDFNKDIESWRNLAEKALINLDIRTAKRIYRLVGDADKVIFLNKIEGVEDKNSLCGQISMLLGEYDNAQEFFLRNSDGIAALNLRRGLRQWDQALSLASTFAQNEVSIIAKEYALELEFNGDYYQALSMYNKALTFVNYINMTDEEKSKHITLCNAGLIRTTLQNGEISKGMKMLRSIQNKELLQECAGILENLKQYNEAGLLYERSEKYEKAAIIFLKAKKYSNVASILPHITSPKIFLQYAKIKEAEGEYTEAIEAYEKAQDYENVVRLILEHSSNIDKAVEIVRKTRSRESARLISKFFQKINDYKSVIEFCLIADMKEDAFEIAQQHNEMEHLAKLLKEDASQDMLLNIASFRKSKSIFICW
jgi:WD repeat-containing protein 19